ncbi:hypothetical protein KC19_8G036900 [Ceratodon purpureus]|uniref:Uncharacterized protein n=1 Tax=Ceratodon purpureus TaxID=3225 RepID=A0A8T0GY71_CERPU|nr:hypothetical protein KC19_8G036900 [Ceratodon purpureus]
MALSSAPSFCFCASVSNDVLAYASRSSTHLVQQQSKGLPRISCKADDTIGSKRKGRRGGRKDPLMDEKEGIWPYLQTQERMIVDLNKQLLVDTENLLHRANNKFGLVLEIAEEANEYLRNNKDEALTKKPILKVMSDRINEAAGENIRDAYCEETFDPQE